MLLTRSADGVVVEVNQSLLRMTGYARESVIGADAMTLGLVPPAVGAALRLALDEHGRLPPTEVELRRADGTDLCVMISTETITFNDERHRMTVFTDITPQKLAERRLVVRHAVGREMAEGQDPERTETRILETLCRGEGFATGGLYLVDPDGRLRCKAFWHEPGLACEKFAAATRAIELSGTTGLLGRVMATGELASIPVDSEEFRRRACASECGLVQVVAVPILRGNKVLGVLDFLRTESRELDGPARAHYAAVSQMLGLFVERLRAEQRHRASEARLRTVLDALNEGIIIFDAQGTIVYWNPRTLALHGLTSTTDFAGALADFPNRYRFVRLDGSILPDAEWPLARIMRGEHLRDQKLWIERLDSDWKRVFRYSGSLVPQPDGSQNCVLSIHDVTESVLATRALHVAEERFRVLTDNIEEVFYITDPDVHGLEYVSPAYERVWLRSIAEVLENPRSWMDSIHPDDRARIAAAYTAQGIGTYDEEYRLVRPDGSLRWIRDRAFPVRGSDGEVLRIVGIARDITHERELREQFHQSQKLEGIGQLAGGVAHDFNNILSVMLMNLELLKPHTPEPHAAVLVQEAMDAGRRAAALTRQLLLFSRRETLTMRSVELNEIVRGMMSMLHRMLGEHVQIELNLSAAPLPITADTNMIEQILLNLAINARDAMGRDGTLTFTTALVGGDAVLRVTDSGCGIPESIRQSIWEPFFTTKEVGKGTGLGLSTVYGIAKQHRGWVSCDSELGVGTTFSVGIPLGEAAPPARAPIVAGSAPAAGNQVVLLVEDNDSLRATLSRVLRRAGYRVFAAASAQDALALWEPHRDTITVLVTDQVMPGELSGSQLAAQLLAERPNLAVITMSGYDPAHPGGTLLEDPRWTFLAKPFEPAALIASIVSASAARPSP